VRWLRLPKSLMVMSRTRRRVGMAFLIWLPFAMEEKRFGAFLGLRTSASCGLGKPYPPEGWKRLDYAACVLRRNWILRPAISIIFSYSSVLSSFDCCFRARSLLIMTFMFFFDPVLSTPSRLESSRCQFLLLDRMSRCLFTLEESEEQNRMHCEAIRNHRNRRRGIKIRCVNSLTQRYYQSTVSS
jgi:hypothetical protein